jgi:predicted nucleotidyltransferase
MDITSLLKKLKRWVAAQPDVVGVALIGSYACGTATEESDVDVIILTTEVRKYFRDKQWVSLFGEAEKTEVEHWRRVQTLRAFYTDGNEIEFNFSTPDWTSIPVESGTRRVVSDGMRILFDPQGILKSVQQVTVRRTIVEAS